MCSGVMGKLTSQWACVPRERVANPDAGSEGPAWRLSLSLGTVCRGELSRMRSPVLWAVGTGAFLEDVASAGLGMGEGSVLQQGEGPALGVGAPWVAGDGGVKATPQPSPPPHLCRAALSHRAAWCHARLLPEQRAVASVRARRAQTGHSGAAGGGSGGAQTGGLSSCRGWRP